MIYRASLLVPLLIGLFAPAAEAQMRLRSMPADAYSSAPMSSFDLLSAPARPDDGMSYSPSPLLPGTSWSESVFLGTAGGVDAEIVRGSNFAAGLTARSERPGYRFNMGRDEPTLEFGAFGEVFFDDWTIIGRVGQDVSQDGGGFVADLGVKWGSQVADRWRLEVGSGVSWASSSYTDRFFGVGNREASGSSGLRLYDPSPGLKDVTISGSVTYSVSESWTIGGLVGAQRLVGPVASSPLVKDENEFFGGFSLDYKF